MLLFVLQQKKRAQRPECHRTSDAQDTQKSNIRQAAHRTDAPNVLEPDFAHRACDGLLGVYELFLAAAVHVAIGACTYADETPARTIFTTNVTLLHGALDERHQFKNLVCTERACRYTGERYDTEIKKSTGEG